MYFLQSCGLAQRPRKRAIIVVMTVSSHEEPLVTAGAFAAKEGIHEEMYKMMYNVYEVQWGHLIILLLVTRIVESDEKLHHLVAFSQAYLL